MWTHLRNLFDRSAVPPPPDDSARPAIAAEQHLAEAVEKHRAGDVAGAERSYRQVLAIHPENADALRNLGVLVAKRGDAQQAESLLRDALSVEPEVAHAHFLLGNLLAARGDTAEAAVSYREAILLDPDLAEAHYNLGCTWKDQGRFDESMMCFRQALALRPNFVEAHNHLGIVYMDQDHLDDAVLCFEKALGINPDFAEAHNNLGVAYRKLNRLDEAVASFECALARKPQFVDALCNLGNARLDQGHLDEAIACYQRAFDADPNHVKASFTQSLMLLQRGDYRGGFALYEKRFELTDANTTSYNRQVLSRLAGTQRWRGEDLHGRTLLIWAEQGLGDSLMMLRYLPLLLDRGVKRLLIYCGPELLRIMHELPGRIESFNLATSPLEKCDYHCPMMSLPYVFGTQLESIPHTVPYVFVPAETTQKWVDRFQDSKGVKVGLVWTGGKAVARDYRLRSIPLMTFAPLRRIPGVVFVSLQKGEAARQLADTSWPMLDWMDECADLLDTAGLVQNLDLVISIDTAVAHLAGALAKPVWLLNRFESDWRWMLERDDSPWYPTMRIFRQPAVHDWQTVMVQVAECLQRWVAGTVPR